MKERTFYLSVCFPKSLIRGYLIATVFFAIDNEAQEISPQINLHQEMQIEAEVHKLAIEAKDNPKQALEKAKEILSRLTKNQPALAKNTLFIIGNILATNGKSDDFLPIINETLLKYSYLNQTNLYAELLYKRALAYKAIGNYSLAEKDLEPAMEILKKSDKKDIYAKVLTTSAELDTLRGFLETALVKYTEAYQISLAENSDNHFPILIDLGLLYTELKDFDNALAFFRDALKFGKEHEKHVQVSTIYYNMARAFHKQEKFEDAVEYYELSSEYSKKHEDIAGIGYAEIGLGYVHMVTEDLETSNQHLIAAREIFSQINDRSMLADVHIQLAQLYGKMKSYKKAVNEAKQAAGVYAENRNLHMLSGTYKILAELHYNMENFNGAYQFLQKYIEVKEQLSSSEREKETSRFKVQFDAEKQSHEYEILAKDNKLQSIALENEKRVSQVFTILFAASLISALLFLFMLYRLRHSRKKLKTYSITDALTGIFNRRRILHLAALEIERHVRHNHTLSFLMLDIDKFKSINDEYGHHIGDQVLQRFTSECELYLRRTDHFGRLGGEEFLVILIETTQDHARKMADRLRLHLSEIDYSAINKNLKVTVSIGTSTLKHGEEKAETVIHRADQAMYQAKEQGRNRVVSS